MKSAILVLLIAVTGACTASETTQKGSTETTATTAKPSPASTALEFKSCEAAQAAGYHDMHRGEPGYSGRLDGDSDGVACDTTKKAAAGRVGNAQVYDQIAADKDCAALQATFDRAEVTSRRTGGPPKNETFVQEKYGDWSQIGVAYMEAADKRMRQLDCY